MPVWPTKLFVPFEYLRIRDSSKRVYDLWIPGVVAIAAGVLAYFVEPSLNVFDSNGLVAHGGGLLRLLIGFFVASLGVVRTLSGDGLDETMLDPCPTIWNRERRENERLTRRRFLTALFGYLSVLSLSLYLLGMIASVVHPPVHAHLVPNERRWLEVAFVAFYCFGFANLVTTTLLGLAYMSDRVARATKKKEKVPGPIASKSGDADDEVQDPGS